MLPSFVNLRIHTNPREGRPNRARRRRMQPDSSPTAANPRLDRAARDVAMARRPPDLPIDKDDRLLNFGTTDILSFKTSVVALQHYDGLPEDGKIKMVRDRRNMYDPNAVRIDVDAPGESVHVGHLPRHAAQWLGPLLDKLRSVDIEYEDDSGKKIVEENPGLSRIDLAGNVNMYQASAVVTIVGADSVDFAIAVEQHVRAGIAAEEPKHGRRSVIGDTWLIRRRDALRDA